MITIVSDITKAIGLYIKYEFMMTNVRIKISIFRSENKILTALCKKTEPGIITRLLIYQNGKSIDKIDVNFYKINLVVRKFNLINDRILDNETK